MENRVDSDQMALRSQLIWIYTTVFSKKDNPCSAEQGLLLLLPYLMIYTVFNLISGHAPMRSRDALSGKVPCEILFYKLEVF